MHRLKNFFDVTDRDGSFVQTQFANTTQSNSLCFAATERYIDIARDNPAISAIITSPELVHRCRDDQAVAGVANPEKEFYRIHNEMAQNHQMRPALNPGIHETARIHKTASIDPYSQIDAHVEVGPNASVMSGSVLGENAVVGPNAVIGAEGHFFKRFDDNLVMVCHAGGVRLAAGAHVLAGAIVSKAMHTDFTEIGTQSVVSVKAHVGHGCKIGERTIIAGSAQISGYTSIGDDCWIGPSATVGNLLKVGNNVKIETGSVVIESLSDGARVSGNYAVKHATNMMEYARKRRGRK